MHLGKFEKKLLFAFLGSSILLFALPLTALTLSNSMFSRQQYHDTVQQSVDNRMALADLYFAGINSVVSDLASSPNVHAWGGSSLGSPAYYDHGSRVMDDERQSTATFSVTGFQLGITRLDEASFVITPNATVSQADFFAPLEAERPGSLREVYDHFAQSTTALTLPIYRDGKLAELMYLTCRSRSSEASLLFAVLLPTDILFSDETPFALQTATGRAAYSTLDDKTLPLLTTVTERMVQTPDEAAYTLDGQLVEVRDFRYINWRIAYLYNDPMPSFGRLFTLCAVLFLVLTGLLFVASRLLTRVLYRPVRQLMRDAAGLSDATDDLPRDVDEFAILSSNVHRLYLLSGEMATLLAEKELLAETKLGRDLLFGTQNSQPPVDADFCVGLIAITTDNETQLLLHKSTLENCVSQVENARFVNCGSGCVAIILQDVSPQRAHTLLDSILASCDTAADLYAVLSDQRHGSENICHCYSQALQILEYRHLFAGCDVLTAQQIQQVDSHMYHYPLQTESAFVQALMTGNDHGLVLFDQLIEENLRQLKLPPEMVKNFLFSLIASIVRVFQTMKATPEELLGRAVDFEFLFQHWNDRDITVQLRTLVADTVAAVQQRNKSSDDRLIDEMRAYIEQNYADNIMLEDMAHVFHISPKYCSALFKKLSDDTFKNYLNRYRVQVAKTILQHEPGVKIQDLSLRVGFNSSNSFIRVFSRYTGETPKAFSERLTN